MKNKREKKILQRKMKNHEEKRNTLSTYLIKRSKIAILIGIILTVWGILSTFAIPKESAPYIAYGIVNVTTSFNGASAIDIDTLVTQEIEEKIKSVQGINTYTSLSRSGISSITLEFEPGQDMTKAMGDIRSKVEEAKQFLPSEIDDDPSITEIDSALEPFLSVIISGDKTVLELTDIAEDMRDILENIPDIAKVDIVGEKEREIVVAIDQDKIESLYVPITEITDAIRNSHRDVPLGTFEIDEYEYSLRFEGKYKTTTDIENIVLKNVGSSESFSLLTIKDIAKVYEREKDDDSITRFAQLQVEEKPEIPTPTYSSPKNAVELSLSKKSESDILKVDVNAKKAIETYISKNIPEGVSVNFSRQLADSMRDDYKDLVKSGLQSFLIVMLFIFFFVGVMEGLVASLIIPITFLVTIGILGFFERTMNFMTNFSMILSLGILVDTAIVIVEGTHQFIKRGYSRRQAALLALNEYRTPLISGTLTTLAVFIPLLSLSGILGQYLSFIPITVSIVLVVSFFVSLFLLPSYAAKLLPKKQDDSSFEKKKGSLYFRTKIDIAIRYVIEKYGIYLKKILSKRKRRLTIISCIIFLFFASFKIPIPFELFPQSDQPFLNIEIEMPEGASTEKTLRTAIEVENQLKQHPEILFMQTNINDKTANISIELLKEKIRKEQNMKNSIDLAEAIFSETDSLAKKYGASIRARSQQNGPPSEFPVGFRIIVQDREKINDAKILTEKLTDILKNIPGTKGVKHDVEEIPGEFRFQVDRTKAIALGIDPNSVANTIRTALNGSTAATITRDGKDRDIIVEFEKDETNENVLEMIKNIRVYSGDKRSIPIGNIITVEEMDALSAIRRVDGDIVFTVSSFLFGTGNVKEITQTFLKKIEEIDIPHEIDIVNAGENEENAELMTDLLRGFIIAVLLIFLILVIQFNAYSQPVLILFTLLFAQIGVSTGLYITDTPRSLAYILGIIALSGIVVNDAIIMIDQINANRRKYQNTEQKRIQDAIVQAGMSRFVPVILTTLTTSAGIIPLIFQDQFWAGLSYTVIFGLMVASILTLFITPALYIQMETEPKKTFLFLLSITLFSLGILFFSSSFFPFVILMFSSCVLLGIHIFLCRRKR
jgi:multidrug efflux pump subunit AcrB